MVYVGGVGVDVVVDVGVEVGAGALSGCAFKRAFLYALRRVSCVRGSSDAEYDDEEEEGKGRPRTA